MAEKLLLLEFNEICSSLIEPWMAQGLLPNFARFYGDSEVFTTKADVTDTKNLEPWIQWYSLHSGIPFDQHGVFHLTDGPSANYDDIWSMLIRQGYRVGNFGSMNAAAIQKDGSFFVADPWTTSESAYPDSLQVFQDFVQSQVQEYTNAKNGLGLGDLARFSWFLATHGLSFKTAQNAARQLVSERVGGSDRRWKRAFILDWLGFDVFRHFVHSHQPVFATFFSNSVAHCQHAYWRCMEPDAFTTKPPQKEIDNFGDAIFVSYKNMDELLGEFFKLEAQGYTLVLASALSQQPFLKLEGIGGQRFYRMHDARQFLGALGIDFVDIQPVMTHQYMARFESSEVRDNAIKILKGFRCANDVVFQADASGETSLYLGNKLRTVVPDDALLAHEDGRFEEMPFLDVFYLIDETKSGCHHPDGLLWLKSGVHRVQSESVSILDVVPTILDWFGIEDKHVARHSLTGRSLLRKSSQPRAA